MGKKFSRLIRMTLCVALFVSALPGTASAASTTRFVTVNGKTYSVAILQDDARTRTIQVKGYGEDSTVSFDKVARSLSATTSMWGVRVASTSRVKLSTSYTAIGSNADVWWNHKYNVYKSGSLYKWYTQKSKTAYKNTTETSGNSGNLEGFRSSLNTCRTNQLSAIASIGAAAAAGIAGALAAAGTVTLSLIIGLLIALGASVGAAIYFLNAWQNIKDCDYHYARY
jgi:hypothetical protein